MVFHPWKTPEFEKTKLLTLKLRKMFIFIFFFLILLIISKLIFRSCSAPINLPPSPPAIPVIGHLHLLKQPLHRSLQKLSDKYGDVLYLRFGSRNVLVISTPSAVQECFTKNDLVFADRPRLVSGKYLNYDHKTIGTAPYGDYWRSLRRLCAIELFSTKRLASFSVIHNEEIQILVKQIYEDCSCRESPSVDMELGSKFSALSFNIMMRMIAGKRYYGKYVIDQESKVFQSIMKEATELFGASNLNDFFPVLRWIDFQGRVKKMQALTKKMDSFFQNLINEHRRLRNEIGKKKTEKMTIIDVMLSLQETEPDFYNNETIKSVIMTLIFAGTETSSTTMEWAMSLLLNHPEEMAKVKIEIDAKVGHDRILNDQDLIGLKHLNCVIDETLRLFPAVPLLLPHESSENCSVSGYNVPKGTMLFVNTWAMHRDPNVWEDSAEFKPERFERGKDDEIYKLVPFGFGRRACPGVAIGRQVIGLALGAVIQFFEWERIGGDEIDMKEQERTGLTMPKAVPLQASCKPRQDMPATAAIDTKNRT